MLDLQHVPNIKDSIRLIDNFKVGEGVVVAIPSNEHNKLKRLNFSEVSNLRVLLAREIKEIRKSTNMPNEILKQIISTNKKKYPNSLKKII